MKFYKVLSIILFVFAIISPMFSFSIVGDIGETEIFGVSGLLRYSWIMLLFIPISLICIIFGVVIKKKKGRFYLLNYIGGFFSLFMLLIFGSYTFIFPKEYDTNIVYEIESQSGINLPHQIKLADENFGEYVAYNIKIIDKKEKEEFEKVIIKDQKWTNYLGTKIENTLPLYYQHKLINSSIFVFYNNTRNEYNTFPPDGEYECTLIAYNYELGSIFIMYKYIVDIS